ncbi:PREDICTED: NAD-dependent histone deacetylase Sir2 [Drosophila arizonae]|uniref:NAD-dependent histone deacetylase Sir2 n=1 Tax=Drosophila arizonae TaxID=7263 RepID=A0ABM1NY16_DROAR|nr:PREDICTED: NAD-dependent histone deacetylase Sir2 [Drosophila arizonae]
MMENFEDMDVRLGHINFKEIGDVHEVQVQAERNELQIFEHTQANFDFGAEIVTTNAKPATAATTLVATATATTPATSETKPKENSEIKTKTLPQMGEHQIGANRNAENVTNAEQNSQQQTNNLERSFSEADDDDEGDEDENEDYKSSWANSDDDDDDDTSSSDCSSVSRSDWKMRWLQREFCTGRVPRQVIASIMPHFATGLAADTEDSVLWDYLAHLLNEPKRRTKLSNVNTFDDVIDLVHKSERIIVLTGAGVSVSCGIPDFRSTNGIYARLAHDFPDLPDPQAMFDINYFKRDPRPFYKFAREIYPGEFKPSPCHRFIKMLETKGKLLRNYTQNIDTLERVAGIQRVIECHGSFSTASCTKCKYKCNADALRADIFAQRIPVCPQCQPNVEHSVDASVAVTEEQLKQLVENGIMKPDIVFFGEGLPDEYHTVMATDKDKCDLLIVIGSSLKVRPVAHIPSSIPASVPQILINREQLHHLKFDVELLGDSDVIINQICQRLSSAGSSDDDHDWKQLCCDDQVLRESRELLPPTEHHYHHHHYHHHRLRSSECEQPSQLDTDTQSLKSNGSVDYLLGSSAGTCSDSGFESSTFTAEHSKRDQLQHLMLQQPQPVASSSHSNAADADREAIERIKSDILVELNETALSCDRLAAPVANGATTAGYRHLSVDSSKDSGIEQCEASNPSNIEVSAGYASNLDPNLSANMVVETKTAAPSLTPTPPQPRRQTIAERLQPGTFYCHSNSCSYVFPGAQVFWNSDFSEDYEEEEDGASVREADLFSNVVASDEEACDLNAVPLSPLLPPALEAHIVTEITNGNALDVDALPAAATSTSSTSSPSNKRRSATAMEQLQSPTSAASPAIESETPPPIKKRRPSVVTATATAAATLTTV